jgi:alkylation response protein AidB-like acyl-CoA dehydrogenase
VTLAIGIARAALEFARDHAVQREAFGGPIIEPLDQRMQTPR